MSNSVDPFDQMVVWAQRTLEGHKPVQPPIIGSALTYMAVTVVAILLLVYFLSVEKDDEEDAEEDGEAVEEAKEETETVAESPAKSKSKSK